MSERVVYAVDVGSTRARPPRFGWARARPDRPKDVHVGTSIEDLASVLIDDLDAGSSVALGIEAPLFIPIPEEASDLSKARAGDGSRSFSAPPGLAVAALAVHQTAWLLREIRSVDRHVEFTTDWRRWPPDHEQLLFVWEAFVSGSAHSPDHVRDAATALKEFMGNEADLRTANAVEAPEPLSLVHAAALWSGWVSDPSLLHSPTLVIKPEQAYEGPLLEGSPSNET